MFEIRILMSHYFCNNGLISLSDSDTSESDSEFYTRYSSRHHIECNLTGLMRRSFEIVWQKKTT